VIKEMGELDFVYSTWAHPFTL